MRVRVITLGYSEGLGGFPEQALNEALAGQEVLDVRDHFFVHGGRPHLALVLTVNGMPRESIRGEPRPGTGEDPGKDLAPERLQLYRSLRQWRNDRARSEGIPSYLIVRNVQLAEICRRLPRTLEELRAIEGIGEATVSKYGRELVAMMPGHAANAPTPAVAPAVAAPETKQ